MTSHEANAQQYPDAEIFLDFMKANPGKASLYLLRNDSVIVSYNAKRRMPLASAMKIIIAVEYAQQVIAGLQNPDELIKESELDKYYVPNTDGGAHPEWKDYLSKKSINSANGISLNEVVKGMIIFSSNANTEFLMDKLGLDKINARWKMLGLHHDEIYPIVSALFMPAQFPELKDEALLSRLKSLSNEDYISRCNAIHQQLKKDTSGSFKKTLPDLPLSIQKIWSDKLPGSNAKDYAELMDKIVNRKYFQPIVQEILDSILEWPMELNPANKTVYKQLGMKGGSTAFVLTIAAYAEDLNSNKTALCFMFNNLETQQQQDLQENLNNFLVNVIGNNEYRNQLKQQLQ